MPVFTKKQPEADVAVAPVVSVEAAQRDLDAKIAEAGRLRELLRTGEVVSSSVEAVERVVVTRHGAQRVTADETKTQRRQVGMLERLQAKRQLPAAEEAVWAATEALEHARAAATITNRARRQATIEAGLRVVRAELPALLRELKTAQDHMQAYAAKMAALDRDLERPCFADSAWAPLLDGAPLSGGSALDFWIDAVRATYLDGR